MKHLCGSQQANLIRLLVIVLFALAVGCAGTPFFVYPDATKNQIYVGTQKEYQAYRRLRPDGGGATPQDKLNAQHAADMASYLKQDAAMRKANTRDLSDPYYFWPSFFELAW